MTVATAPGKVILFGEHAVVYGRPAIAAPVSQVRATARVEPSAAAGVFFSAPDLGSDFELQGAPADDPLVAALLLVQEALEIGRLPNIRIIVSSQIPVASGLGSGAAIAAATIRALAEWYGAGQTATDEWVSKLTFEVEKLHHGTPSGIDNTVVTYERPVFFTRKPEGNIIEAFKVGAPLRLLIGDTGVRSSTKVAVSDVRRCWEKEPDRYNDLFDGCGSAAAAARRAIEKGDLTEVGRLMSRNHELLQKMGVSSNELNSLVDAAMEAGAAGAKLSGAGRGGNMIALVEVGVEAEVEQALLAAGAANVLRSVVEETSS